MREKRVRSRRLRDGRGCELEEMYTSVSLASLQQVVSAAVPKFWLRVTRRGPRLSRPLTPGYKLARCIKDEDGTQRPA